MGLLFENISMALSSIKSNKMRSFLTMLGIIIGISSVITISSLGGSINKTMNKFFSTFGKNRIMLYANPKESDYYFSYGDLITEEDIKTLKEKFPDIIKYAAPYQYQWRIEVKENNSKASISVQGVDYNYFDFVKGYDFVHGGKFKKQDIASRRRNIIVSDELAKKLFYKTNIIGETINIKGNSIEGEFTVVGVYHKDKTIFDNLNSGDTSEVAVPYTTFKDFDKAYKLDIFLSENADLSRSANDIKKFFNKYKQKDGEFYDVKSLDEQVDELNQLFQVLSLGLGAIAAISLVVGGIGIMNIMLVSVTERTREIGIRKSLGARKKDILSQFLVESIVLSGVGGIIGTILGILFSFMIAKLINTESVLPVKSIIIAIVFSACVGIFFGLYPANKAAKLDPIDALRYE